VAIAVHGSYESNFFTDTVTFLQYFYFVYNYCNTYIYKVNTQNKIIVKMLVKFR
jgi:hypothetical protein